MKHITAALLALVLLLGLLIPAHAAGLSAFTYSKPYIEGQFVDVSPSDTLAPNIRSAYQLGMMEGTSADHFLPRGNLTLAQAIVISCRIHSIYYGTDPDFSRQPGRPWYAPYTDYAIAHEIILNADTDLGVPVHRSVFARLLGNAMPDEALPVVSRIQDHSIPDVPAVHPCCEAIYRLYRAGVLTGSDARGTFHPESAITRGEAAAIISRMADPTLRRAITLVRPNVPLVPLEQLQNLKSLRRRATMDQMRQAYREAEAIVRPLVGMPREDQLMGVMLALRQRFEAGMEYTTDTPHYNDPYGYFVLGVASCAGCTRATGLCLNMLGIPYEHVNENQWSHQWCRVPVGYHYWICDAFGYCCQPEPAPYAHPYF